MSKEMKHRRDERKKPMLTLKERRARKHEKQRNKHEQSHETPDMPDII